VLAVQAEDLVFQGLEAFEDLIDTRIEAAGARGEFFAGNAVFEPHILRRADQRSGAARSADEQGQSGLDRRRDAVVVAAMRSEIELKVLAHRRPVKEVRFVEGADLATHELGVDGELVQEPRFVRRRPRDERGLQGMHDAGADEPFGDLVVAIAAAFGVQGVQALGGHDHDLAVLVRLDDVDEGPVAFRFEHRVLGGAPRGHARDELAAGEGGAEAAEHLGVHRIIEVEDITRIGVQDRHQFHAVAFGGGVLPAQGGRKAVPVRLSVLEGQEGGGAEPSLGAVVDQRLLGRPCPFCRRPRRGRGEVLRARDERLHDGDGNPNSIYID